MPRLTNAVPKYRKHRASGQAVVSLHGRDHYLGPYGTKASKVEYDRLIAEWLANGRQAPPIEAAPLTVGEVLARYWRFAKARYRKPNGEPSGELDPTKLALRHLRELYSLTPAADFGPRALKTVQEAMVKAGWARKSINLHVSRIKRFFRWAVAEELIPASVLHGLEAVPGLRAGHTEAPDPEPIGPVSAEVVDATLAFLPPVPAAMVQFQRMTGARPAEVCILRPCDVDRSREIWVYRPSAHKTEHHGRSRTIFIGPKAQEVLVPYLLRPADAFCFDPRESERKRLEEVHSRRKTPLSCGNRPGTNKVRKPKRKAGDRYETASYRRAIWRAVEKANEAARKEAGEDGVFTPIPRWSPNQLRHSAATEIRREFGLEAAQVVLGHAKADTTQIYAERDARLAEEVVKKLG